MSPKFSQKLIKVLSYWKMRGGESKKKKETLFMRTCANWMKTHVLLWSIESKQSDYSIEDSCESAMSLYIGEIHPDPMWHTFVWAVNRGALVFVCVLDCLWGGVRSYRLAPCVTVLATGQLFQTSHAAYNWVQTGLSIVSSGASCNYEWLILNSDWSVTPSNKTLNYWLF